MFENLPKGPFAIVLADPPWKYNDGKVPRGDVDFQYPTMNLEDIKSLPVQYLCKDDCALFLWATFPMFKEAIEVVEAWGFKYKGLGFSWTKINKDGSPFFGIGHYTRSNVEVCLLGFKGNAGKKEDHCQ